MRQWHRNIKPASKYPIIFEGRSTHVAQVLTQGLTEEEIEHNCNLIAAVPEMLWALKQLHEKALRRKATGYKFDKANQDLFEFVEMVIHKAEGKWQPI